VNGVALLRREKRRQERRSPRTGAACSDAIGEYGMRQSPRSELCIEEGSPCVVARVGRTLTGASGRGTMERTAG